MTDLFGNPVEMPEAPAAAPGTDAPAPGSGFTLPEPYGWTEPVQYEGVALPIPRAPKLVRKHFQGLSLYTKNQLEEAWKELYTPSYCRRADGWLSSWKKDEMYAAVRRALLWHWNRETVLTLDEERLIKVVDWLDLMLAGSPRWLSSGFFRRYPEEHRDLIRCADKVYRDALSDRAVLSGEAGWAVKTWAARDAGAFVYHLVLTDAAAGVAGGEDQE